MGTSLAFAGATQNVDDPKDAPGRVDIKSVKVSHDAGKLFFKVGYYANVKEGEESGISIYAGRWSKVGGASYQVIPGFGVTNGDGMRTGKVKVTRPDKKTVRYKLADKTIDNPATFKWQVCVCVEGDRQDVAPKKPKKFTMAG
jgi:hypothetical protein